jgi:hypothetical protein
MTEPEQASDRPPVRWSDPFKVPSIWLPPAVLVAFLVVVMTLVYFGSVVNPTGHLDGLPVAVVDQDTGGHLGSRRVDFGAQLTAGLMHSPAVSSRSRRRGADPRLDRQRIGARVLGAARCPGHQLV